MVRKCVYNERYPGSMAAPLFSLFMIKKEIRVGNAQVFTAL